MLQRAEVCLVPASPHAPRTLHTFTLRRNGNRSFSSGLRPQGTLRGVPRGQLQVSFLLFLCSGEQDFPNREGVLWQERCQGQRRCWPDRVEATGGPADRCGSGMLPSPCTLHPALHIFSLSKIASLEGGSGGSSQLILRSFPRCVHSPLAVSLDLVSLPGPSALPPPSPLGSARSQDPLAESEPPSLHPPRLPSPTSKPWLSHPHSPLSSVQKSTHCT